MKGLESRIKLVVGVCDTLADYMTPTRVEWYGPASDSGRRWVDITWRNLDVATFADACSACASRVGQDIARSDVWIHGTADDRGGLMLQTTVWFHPDEDIDGLGHDCTPRGEVQRGDDAWPCCPGENGKACACEEKCDDRR